MMMMVSAGVGGMEGVLDAWGLVFLKFPLANNPLTVALSSFTSLLGRNPPQPNLSIATTNWRL